MADDIQGAAGRHLGRVGVSGLADLINWLMECPVETLKAMDPMAAAREFKINPNHAAGYIQQQQQMRGVPMLVWKPVQWPVTAELSEPAPTPPVEPGERKVAFAATWGWGDVCPHGVTYPGPCDPCEDELLRLRGPVKFPQKNRPQGRRWDVRDGD